MTVRVAALHTVPALVPIFHELLTQRTGIDVVHIADARLLATAVAEGITEEIIDSIRHHLITLQDAGATSVLVTCSSIGEAAETASEVTGVPMTRVDAAMAAEAVRRAMLAGGDRDAVGRILALATLEATLGPTMRLAERCVPADEALIIDAIVVKDAAAARALGDQAAHDRLVAEAVAAGAGADVIVLAQASMAAAVQEDPRVLSSPRSGAEAFLASLQLAGNTR